MYRCDECRELFENEHARRCPLNGDDETRVCSECCKNCGYNFEGYCTFLD